MAKNLAKIEKPPFWEFQNIKISPAKIQKSGSPGTDQPKKEISQTTVVSLVSNLANPFLG